jgi:murein DD-endopeptidase MepM/ murein hydrolase activator NlpD
VTPSHRGSLVLPSDFTPTHFTSGLPGYPAVDLFGPPGQPVRADFYGLVRRISGRACELGGKPGGAYGRSLYIANTTNGWDRYLTHLAQLHVTVGERIGPGSLLATICDAARAGKPGTSHVHYGLRKPH